MTIPTYTVIADAEIDPEAPLTSSLFYRLRNNICALLGIDPSDTNPSVAFQASTLNTGSTGAMSAYADGNTSTVTSAEVIVSRIDATLEQVQTQALGYNHPYNVANHLEIGPASIQLAIDNPQNTPQKELTAVVSIDVPYTGLTPDSVDVTLDFVDVLTGSVSSGSVSLPLDNAWHDVYDLTHNASGEHARVQGKARATSTDVYLQLRADVVKVDTQYPYASVNLNVRRTEYASKA